MDHGYELLIDSSLNQLWWLHFIEDGGSNYLKDMVEGQLGLLP